MSDEKTDSPSFEEALEKLESIVDSMEQGQVPLAALLAQYEEGMKLLKICEGRLQDAELKIEILKQARDAVQPTPFAPGRTGD